MQNETPAENMGAGHITVLKYTVGYLFAVALTVGSFALAMTHTISMEATLTGLFVFAVLQMLVHLHYFLHLDRSSQQRWNVIALAFTALLLFIFVAGTLWVMYTLNARMM
jgi:cytochrome o ubiquinol oxidase subunit IV